MLTVDGAMDVWRLDVVRAGIVIVVVVLCAFGASADALSGNGFRAGASLDALCLASCFVAACFFRLESMASCDVEPGPVLCLTDGGGLTRT